MEQGRRRKRRRPKSDFKKTWSAIRAVLLLMAAVFALYYFSQSPFFSLKRIDLTGTKRLHPQELIQASGLNKGENIFRINLNQVKSRILTQPLIDQVTVKRQYPDRIAIQVVERRPRGIVLADGKFLIVDRNAYILEQVDNLSSYSLPIVTGLQPDATAAGKRVSHSDTLLALLAALQGDQVEYYSEFHLAQEGQIIAYNRQGMMILLGSAANLPEKISRAATYVGSLDNSDQIAYVDISAVQAPAVRYKDQNNQKNGADQQQGR